MIMMETRCLPSTRNTVNYNQNKNIPQLKQTVTQGINKLQYIQYIPLHAVFLGWIIINIFLHVLYECLIDKCTGLLVQ